MPRIYCPNTIKDCLCEGDVFGNFSAEAPDKDRFLSVDFVTASPLLGNLFGSLGCKSWCWSTISQLDADNCAKAQATLCTFDPPPNNPNPPLVTYSNTAQSCSYTCPDGRINTVTINAGAVVSLTQAQANAIAYSLACSQAEQNAHCGNASPIVYYSEEITQRCAADAANSEFVITIPAGTYTSNISQDFANILAEEAAFAIIFDQCYWLNTEFTLECPEGTTGDAVTIPAGTYMSKFSQEDADNQAGVAASEALECENDFDCGSTPQSVGAATWVHGSGNTPPCGDFSVSGGSGPWSVTTNNTTCTSQFIEIVSSICNPGEPYEITVTAPWNKSGTYLSSQSHIIQLQLAINNSVTHDTRDLGSGPFTPMVASGMLAQGVSTVKIRVAMSLIPNPSLTAFSTSDLTITPLSPP